LRPLRQLDEPPPAPDSLMEVGLRLLALIDARRLHEWQIFHLSVTQLRYLQVLAEYSQAPRLSEVARRTHVHPAHITSMTKRMQALGLIDLVVDPADRRARRVALTQSGRAAFYGQESMWRSYALALTAGLRQDQTRLLAENLKRLSAMLLGSSPARKGSRTPALPPGAPTEMLPQPLRPLRTHLPGTPRNGRSALP